MKQVLVRIDQTLEDNIAKISRSRFESLGFSLSRCSALEIHKGNRKEYLCVQIDDHVQSSNEIKMSQGLAESVHVKENEEIFVKKMNSVPSASVVVVSAASIDDYEIIESNQRHVEHIFLKQTKIAYSKMEIRVRLHKNCFVQLIVQRIVGFRDVNSQCYELVNGTELAIETRSRHVGDGCHPVTAFLCNIVFMKGVCSSKRIQRCVESRKEDFQSSIFVSSKIAAKYCWCTDDVVHALPLQEVTRTAFELKKDSLSAIVHAPNGLSTSPVVIRASKKLSVYVYSDSCCSDEDCKMKKFVDGFGILSFSYPPGEALYLFSLKNKNQKESRGELCSEWSQFFRDSLDFSIQSYPQQPSLELLKVETLIDTWEEHHSIFRNYLIEGNRGMGKTLYLQYLRKRIPSVYLDGKNLGTMPPNQRVIQLKVAFTTCSLVPSILLIDDIHEIFLAGHDPVEKNIDQDLNIIDIGLSLRHLLELQQNTGKFQIIATATPNTQWIPQVLQRYFETRFSAKLSFQPLEMHKAYEFFASSLNSVQGFNTEDSATQIGSLFASFTPKDIISFTSKMSNLILLAQYPAEKAFEIIKNEFDPIAYEDITYRHPSCKAPSDTRLLDDIVYGMAEVKKKLHDVILLPLQNYEKFSALPVKLSRGVLLYGPTGSGKTYIINKFLKTHSLRYVKINGPEVMQKYVGSSEAKVREIFETAQKMAPCVLFIDEIDACVPQRGSDNMGITDRIVNQFLCELDGVESRGAVYVIAATSRPEVIDKALLRPGRLDTHAYCGIPSLTERACAVQHLCRSMNCSLGVAESDDLARSMDGWSYADIKSAFDSSLEESMVQNLNLHGFLKSSKKRPGLQSNTDQLTFEFATMGNLEPIEAEPILKSLSIGNSATIQSHSNNVPSCSASILKDIIKKKESSVPISDIQRILMFQKAKGRTAIVGQRTTTI